MRSSIVLIYPKTGLDIKGVSVYPPLSVLRVASTLVGDYDVTIIDQRVDSNWRETLQRQLNKDPLFVGISAMTGSQIKYGLEAAKLVKDGDTAIPLVWGGVHPTLLPEETAKDPYVDIVVVGEGERTASQLAGALAKGNGLNSVNNIIYKKGNDVFRTSLSGLLDLNELPPIPYNLVNVEHYISSKIKSLYSSKRMLPVITSRGCPCSCTFCCNPRLSKSRWRGMSAEKAYKEVMELKESYNLDSVSFFDEGFMLNSKRTQRLIEMLGGDIHWYIQGRMDEIARADLEKCEKNGLIAVQPGVETGSPRMLGLIKKGETVDDYVNANKALSKTNILACYNFMMGFPNETAEDLKMSIDFALRLLEDNPNSRLSAFYIYTPYPGTELFDVAVKEGFSLPGSLPDWGDYSRHHLKTPWIQQDIQMYKTILLTSKIIDGHALDSFAKIPSFILSALGLMAKKWYQGKWKKYDFRRTLDIKTLNYFYNSVLKVEFN